MACEAPGPLVAVSAVIANMPVPVDVSATCRPDSGMPMLVIDATDDPLIPWSTVKGKANRDVSTAALSWAFFRQFPPMR